ncbi:MAG: HlyC/CorC family transporter, partial [Spirochaetes bacterium]|nr:HlyC/CorC family transporter [Spirochaetota bacterium]
LIAIKIFPRWLAIILITFLILILGEVTPKTLAIKAGASISVFVAPILYFLSIILTPFIYIFRKISTVLVFINSLLFFRNANESKNYHSDEMIEVIKESQDNGTLNKEEGNILGNLIQFSSSDISRVARPRNEIFSISINTILGEIHELIKDKKYSRVPIWEDNEENIIGILYIKDLLKIKSKKRKLSYYRNILRKPFFIPESVKTEQLLKNFQATRNHIAIVIDEYGGISGMVTLEDVLEEIIGEIIDKDDIKPLYYKYNVKMIEIEAKIEIKEFNKIFKTNLKSREAITVSGYILEKIKRIPEVGEIIVLNNLQFRISKAASNKIEKIMITKLKNN